MVSHFHRACLLAAWVCLSASSAGAGASYSVLHSFRGAESNPQAALTSDGHGNLYGTTANGGGADYGAVFTVRADGTEFQRLHTFSDVNDGFTPTAPLILDGFGHLFGTTAQGGPSGGGTLFTIGVDGTGFQVLHSFAGGASDGSSPAASLTLDDSGTLYGTTSAGGSSNFGTVFRIKTDGTRFQILHSFAGGPSDGRAPGASLLLDGSGNLYGTTRYGGQQPCCGPGVPGIGEPVDGAGTIFRIRTDGTGYQLLRAFPIGTSDAAFPSGSLITDGSGNLYGMTLSGGSLGRGTVFRVGMDGSAFLILHSFAGGSSDGMYPVGSLVLDRLGNLFGITQNDFASGAPATIFRVRTDATAYQVLHTFGDTNEGRTPAGSLILDGSATLLGAMAHGGASNAGTLFSVETDGSGFQVSYTFAGFMNDGSHPRASVVPDGSGYVYGTTPQGGFSNAGTVFRIRPDGTGFQLLHAFSGEWSSWGGPDAPLILDRAGSLYGTTNGGGPANLGTIFRMRTDGTGFETLHAFLGGANDGRNPTEALVMDGADNLYGTTPDGGSDDAGTIFTMKADGTAYQVLHTFTSESAPSEGEGPFASLLLDGSGNLLGTTAYAGPGNHGTVFKMGTDGTGFRVLHSFTGGSNDGSLPTGTLTMDVDGNIYGTTLAGGSSNAGTVFKMRPDGTNLQLLHSFARSPGDGEAPNAAVLLDGRGNLYGTTLVGGPSDLGTVFTVRTDGTGFQILHAFGLEAADGQNPAASLFLNSSGTLFGTTGWGGTGGFGTAFVLSIGQNHPIAIPGPFVPVRRR